MAWLLLKSSAEDYLLELLVTAALLSPASIFCFFLVHSEQCSGTAHLPTEKLCDCADQLCQSQRGSSSLHTPRTFS